MSRADLISQLVMMGAETDPDAEINHDRADGMLLDYINDQEITDAYDSIKKWYA